MGLASQRRRGRGQTPCQWRQGRRLPTGTITLPPSEQLCG